MNCNNNVFSKPFPAFSKRCLHAVNEVKTNHDRKNNKIYIRCSLVLNVLLNTLLCWKMYVRLVGS